MATYYVYSGAAGGGTGADWTNAYTTLTLAFSGHAAGDVYYVAHDHAESTGAAITLTTLGTLVSPVRILCVNRAGSVPPVSADLRTTATVSTTGAFGITFATGATYWYGISFLAGTSTNSASLSLGNAGGNVHTFKSCKFQLNNTNGTSRIILANTGNVRLYFDDCIFLFGDPSQTFSGANAAEVTIVGGSMCPTGSVPTTLFTTACASTRLIGVDLSSAGFGEFNNYIAPGIVGGFFLLQDCKLSAAGTSIVSSTIVGGAFSLYVVRSDSTDTNYSQQKFTYAGAQNIDLAVYRTGGASDGTTPLSWRVGSYPNAEWTLPFEAMPRVIWNDVTGSRTITLYGIHDGGAVPLNDEIWMEIYYLGTSGFPISSMATTGKADILATGANVSSDSSTWSGSTTKFKLTTTITVAEKGPIYVIIKNAKVNYTFYIDPKIEVT